MTDSDEPQEEAPEAPPATPAAPASVAVPAADVRNSPEFRQKAAEARANARRVGDLENQLRAARTEAAEQQAAAEAQARDRQAAEIQGILGDEGVAEWEAIAELAATDQVGAARRFRDLMGAMAKSPPDPAVPPAGAPTTPPPAAGGSVVAQGTRFPPSRVDAAAPLGVTGEDNSWQAIGDEAQARFDAAVARQQGSLQDRSRFTGKDRTAAIMDVLVAGVARKMQEVSGRR